MRYIDQPYSKAIVNGSEARFAETLITTVPNTLSRNTLVPSGTNCLLAGPITVPSSVTLTVEGTLTIV